ncbi:MAG: Minf_1886 family protein [Planctomycetota bacterium]
MNEPTSLDWNALRDAAGPYSAEAFTFVHDGLGHTVRTCREDAGPDEQHVSGAELCFGLRDLAQKRYGLLARTVLERWGIHRTEDFGKIVFAMVDLGLMRKTDEDSFEDFVEVFDFDEGFEPLETV